MRVLRIVKGSESYDLTYSETDPNYDQDRRDLILKGWDVSELTTKESEGS